MTARSLKYPVLADRLVAVSITRCLRVLAREPSGRNGGTPMFKPWQGILSYLKQVGRGVDLPLDALRPFQEFEKALVAGLESYEGRDPAITYGMQSFTKIEMFGIALMT